MASLNHAVGAPVPKPTPALDIVASRLAATLDQIGRLNGEMLLMRGNVFGEGETGKETGAAARSAGTLGTINGLLDEIGHALDRAEEQVGSLRKLG